jgi:cation diffusion facilitator CzcD-associated flavoprotein CzcO
MTTGFDPNSLNIDFDPDELRKRYEYERDKRIRAEGAGQFIATDGRFAYMMDDPYVEPGFTREAVTKEVDVLIIGAGFGGLLVGSRLRDAGCDDFLILDSAGDFGGTWYWNRYPGAACDVESYIYLPLLEETGYMPRERYSFQPEIFEYTQSVAKKFDLYENALFQTTVTEVRWLDDEDRWLVQTDREDAIRARFVTLATGSTTKPKLPGIPGIETFKGHMFHTSRWDYGYTGGGHDSELTKLRDKNIAIIGTGATAIQCVPRVAKSAKHTYVLQRTPSTVGVRGNRDTDPGWWARLTQKPGWQRARRENFNDVVAGVPVSDDHVSDGWTDIFRKLETIMPSEVGKAKAIADGPQLDPESAEAAFLAEIVDYAHMNDMRDHVAAIVKDEKVAEKLKPWYRLFCKRPTFNDEYLACFNLPNVDLIDTSDEKGVERMTENGFIANGQEHQVDCIILSTGFDLAQAYRVRDLRQGGASVFRLRCRG